jgi:hypothetical protein
MVLIIQYTTILDSNIGILDLNLDIGNLELHVGLNYWVLDIWLKYWDIGFENCILVYKIYWDGSLDGFWIKLKI